MFLKRESYRFGIWRQMAAGLLAVFLAGGLILYGGIHTRINLNREAQIMRELQSVRENTEIYVRQLLMLNDANNDEASYRKIAGDIAGELRVTGGMGLSVLDREGGYLDGSLMTDTPEEDIRQAIGGNAAFTMTYPDADTMLVYFSMPVVIEERTIGIIRYRMDTSALLVQGKQTENLVCQIAVSVFVVVFLLIAFLMSRFLSPVQKLTKITRQVVKDLAEERIDMQMPAQLADSRRRDEIGELSRNFSVMLGTIGTQFRNMREDRERIIKLLGSRQEFYNNVTHELKTPLTTIQGYAQLLEDDEGMDGELTRRGLHQILTESTRLHKMVLQLLEMSDKSVGMEAKPFDLAQTGYSVAQALEVKAKRYEMHIRAEFKEALHVRGIEERLRQVVINLADNAIKYGDSHSTIRIFGYRRNGYVLLAVQNSGKGLNPEEQERIFEPFYRVDKTYSREQGSAGLGLSICKKIMDEHGGQIGMKSVPGKRTVFYIRLNEEDHAAI